MARKAECVPTTSRIVRVAVGVDRAMLCAMMYFAEKTEVVVVVRHGCGVEKEKDGSSTGGKVNKCLKNDEKISRGMDLRENNKLFPFWMSFPNAD